MQELSEQLENYLKEIYEEEESKGHAKVTDLILAFDVSPGTISKAVSRLEFMGLIRRGKNGIKLTEDGRRLAERLVRAHRLSERLLTDLVGVDWIRAHQIAHKLEHAWPADVLDKLDQVLGRPRACPHGHPIPGRGDMKGFTLWSLDEGRWIVKLILREEEWILREITKLGLRPGEEVEILRKEDDRVVIKVHGNSAEVPKALAENVIVYEKRVE
jgi:DtxR family Mn-dependent transcriptional regulator